MTLKLHSVSVEIRWSKRPGRAVAAASLTALLWIVFAASALAQTNSLPQSAADLKRLSVAELMNIEVTSLSRSESTLRQSPAAVFVITPEMIRRSGATTFPERFHMVPGMDVARIDGNK